VNASVSDDQQYQVSGGCFFHLSALLHGLS